MNSRTRINSNFHLRLSQILNSFLNSFYTRSLPRESAHPKLYNILNVMCNIYMKCFRPPARHHRTNRVERQTSSRKAFAIWPMAPAAFHVMFTMKMPLDAQHPRSARGRWVACTIIINSNCQCFLKSHSCVAFVCMASAPFRLFIVAHSNMKTNVACMNDTRTHARTASICILCHTYIYIHDTRCAPHNQTCREYNILLDADHF